MSGPGALAHELAQLPVTIERVRVHVGAVAVPSYPGGLRPTAWVELSGAGSSGFGECVAFAGEAQRRFQARTPEWVTYGRSAVGSALRGASAQQTSSWDEAEGWERAALEGAVIDLALRQGRLSLSDLCSVRPVAGAATLRWVGSFAAEDAPVERMRQLRAETGCSEFKVDVAPGWCEATIRELARAPGLRVLDFKDLDVPELAVRLSRALPQVWFEDPPAGCEHPRIALDRPLRTAHDVARALAAGRALNLKAPRMGGFLTVLHGLERALSQGALVYFGGMFEVGPGREQARALAALFCADAPNDLAPFPGGKSSMAGASPARVALDRVGFGATLDWATLGTALC